MYTHPETARLLTAQRVQERHAQANAHRLAWLPRLSRDRSMRRPAVYPEPRRV